MEKRNAEERNGLEDLCSQLLEEQEDEIRKLLQRQQDSLLVRERQLAKRLTLTGLTWMLTPFLALSPSGFKENLVSAGQ